MTAMADDISRWIAERVAACGARGAVVGLSGGIDSAVTAALCRRALGANVLGVLMPCESDPMDEEDARLVASWLKLATVTVRLERPYRALLDELPDAAPAARANVKPRLRMATLYAFANSLGYLVAGTGNRSELMAGYFTKHGDGGVDILPMGGLLKREVRALAGELGVPERIVVKPPSAGLWAGQTDEGEMGLTYDELDGAIEALEAGRGDDVPPALREKVGAMIERSAHKRCLAPVFRPGVESGPPAAGRDRPGACAEARGAPP